MWTSNVIDPNKMYWEYRCDDCGWLMHHPMLERPTQCGNRKCDSYNITVGRPGTLGGDQLKRGE